MSIRFIPRSINASEPVNKQQKLVIPHLKQQTYGEVLTNNWGLKSYKRSRRKKGQPAMQKLTEL